jgi:predicted Rossmann-fold nucleotide-binding protein
MKVLICGGRDLNKADAWNLLEREAKDEIAHAIGCFNGVKIETVIHGGCRGADEAAAVWGASEHAKVIACPADWKKHGKAAGPMRNRRMLLDHKPDIVIALPGGRGTADMIRQAEAEGVRVVRLPILSERVL